MEKQRDPETMHDSNERLRRLCKRSKMTFTENIDEALNSIFEAERNLNNVIECFGGAICGPGGNDGDSTKYIDGLRFHFNGSVKTIKEQILKIESLLDVDYNYPDD